VHPPVLVVNASARLQAHDRTIRISTAPARAAIMKCAALLIVSGQEKTRIPLYRIVRGKIGV
jgi:hypothetical protein